MMVKRFDRASGERLAVLLASDPNAPYRAHRAKAGSAAYDCWAAQRGAALLANASGAFETKCGAIGWKHLPWDSELFGFSAARLEILATTGGYTEGRETACVLVRRVVEDATFEGVEHLVARIDSSLIWHAHALEGNGFELIDGIQTFALASLTVTDFPAGTRLATAEDEHAIADIARSSFVHDRFHNDVAIGTETANRVHEAWARNSVSGQAADAVVVAESDEGVDAFVTVKLDDSLPGLRIATIPLVATGLEVRGKGSGRRATEAALAWAKQQGADVVEVGTQISNVPAARLYQSAGFRTTAISLTYRKIIE
jgi:ribosomal protein S18 acetylase RimI-like enzyme